MAIFQRIARIITNASRRDSGSIREHPCGGPDRDLCVRARRVQFTPVADLAGVCPSKVHSYGLAVLPGDLHWQYASDECEECGEDDRLHVVERTWLLPRTGGETSA